MDQWKSLQDKAKEDEQEFINYCLRGGLSGPQYIEDDTEGMILAEGDLGVSFWDWYRQKRQS